MELLIAIGAASGAAGILIGWLGRTLLHRCSESEPSPVDTKRGDRSPHVHRWDTMLADGKWRCGICNKARRR